MTNIITTVMMNVFSVSGITIFVPKEDVTFLVTTLPTHNFCLRWYHGFVKEMTSNMTLAVIVVHLVCHEVEYSWRKILITIRALQGGVGATK